MKHLIIPIASFKRIESWLTDEAGFERSMLHSELDYMSDVYLLPKSFADVQDLYLSIKKEEQNIPYPNRGTDNDKYEFNLTVGKNLVLECGDFDAEHILNLWNLYYTNEDPAYEQKDQDVFNGILLIVATINIRRHVDILILAITLQTLNKYNTHTLSVQTCCVFTRCSMKRKRRKTIPSLSNTISRR
mgnify:CR=1 FL=1